MWYYISFKLKAKIRAVLSLKKYTLYYHVRFIKCLLWKKMAKKNLHENCEIKHKWIAEEVGGEIIKIKNMAKSQTE